jgi:hypothetical protein
LLCPIQGVTDYAISMLDPEGIVSNWNLGAERIKGYKAIATLALLDARAVDAAARSS